MLEEQKSVREETMGLLRVRSPKRDDHSTQEEKRRSELLEQIRNGAFEKH